MPANANDGLRPEERAAKERLILAMKALAACVNVDAIVQMVEEPMRGTYRSSVPMDEQTRTVTFVVRARDYDAKFPPP